MAYDNYHKRSIGTHELGTDRRRVHQHVGRISPHAQRVDVGVFECEQVVVRGVLGQRTLEGRRLLVGDAAQPPDPQRVRSAQSSAAQSRCPRSSTRRARKDET